MLTPEDHRILSLFIPGTRFIYFPPSYDEQISSMLQRDLLIPFGDFDRSYCITRYARQLMELK